LGESIPDAAGRRAAASRLPGKVGLMAANGIVVESSIKARFLEVIQEGHSKN
jgi:hypothetical protein